MSSSAVTSAKAARRRRERIAFGGLGRRRRRALARQRLAERGEARAGRPREEEAEGKGEEREDAADAVGDVRAKGIPGDAGIEHPVEADTAEDGDRAGREQPDREVRALHEGADELAADRARCADRRAEEERHHHHGAKPGGADDDVQEAKDDDGGDAVHASSPIAARFWAAPQGAICGVTAPAASCRGRVLILA